MNILVITEYFPESENAELTGGVESRTYHLARELAGKHRITILCSRQPGQKKKSIVAGIEVIRCGPVIPYSRSENRFKRLLFSLAALIKGMELMKSRKFDIIEGHSFYSYLPAILLGRERALLTYHEVWIGNWIKNTGSIFGIVGEVGERLVLAMASHSKSRFIAVSGFTKSRLKPMVRQEVIVVHNGIDLQESAGIKAKKPAHPTICCMGRLSPQKRVSDFVRALKLVQEKMPAVRGIIIGDGAELENLKGLASQLGLSNRIQFKGFIPRHAEAIGILKSSTIFCSPSVVEGFGIAVVEAMACGIPYVVTDIEPFVEVTHNGRGGLIFRREDYKDLAQKIITLLQDREQYHKKATEGKKLAKSYGWNKIAKKIESVYHECLQK